VLREKSQKKQTTAGRIKRTKERKKKRNNRIEYQKGRKPKKEKKEKKKKRTEKGTNKKQRIRGRMYANTNEHNYVGRNKTKTHGARWGGYAEEEK